jgi:hypothetical protein
VKAAHRAATVKATTPAAVKAATAAMATAASLCRGGERHQATT